MPVLKKYRFHNQYRVSSMKAFMIPHMEAINAPANQKRTKNFSSSQNTSLHKITVTAENPMDTPNLRVWRDLGVVDTIYEEEAEDSSSTITPSLSPLISSPPMSPFHSQVEAWSAASGQEIDVVIHVQDSSFYLHKAPLKAKSDYLKRLLKDSTTEFTLSPPLKITAETFTLVTEFCYGAHILITPFNVASLRVAADLLEMKEFGGAPADNLLQKTETYFRRIVAVNREHASIVLQSSLSLLPEAETTACLVSRCIEALRSMDDGDGVVSSLDEVIKLPVKDFQVVVESMNQMLTNHDILYRIVDLYLKGKSEKITEEEKTRISNYIDCTTLSPQLLMHAVQNPRMPLRFVVQAMFVEQLNTRRSIFSAADQRNRTNPQSDQQSEDSVTLGAILERDAALRQVAQLKATMNSTNSRIQSLEKELIGMRKLLHESEKTINELDSGRSQSFRFSSENENKIGRGQIGSVSSASLRFTGNIKDRLGGSTSSEESFERNSPAEKNLGRRLINGLKSAFRISALVSRKKSDTCDSAIFEGDDNMSYEVGHGDVIVIKKNLPFERESGSRV